MKNVNILKDLNTLNKLHTSSVESHTTNNGIVDFTCDNAGYVDNVAIEGKTLVNLNTFTAKGYDGNRIWFYDTNYSLCTNNAQYTIFNTSDKLISIQYTLNGNWVDGEFIYLQPNTSQLVTVYNNHQFGGIFGGTLHGWSNSDNSYNELKQSIIILEGDHADKPISYFEGLKSVGQGDNIEVLSYKRGSENLASNLTFAEGFYVKSTDGTSDNKDSTKFKCSNEYIEIEGGCEYLFDNINGQFATYDSSKNVIPLRWQDLKGDWLKGDDYQATFVYAMPKNAKYVRINLPISNLKPYSLIKTKSDKKQIPVTLRSLPNGVKDTIEKRGNKYVKVQRCGEVTLNGNESDDKIVEGVPTTTTYRFGFYLNNLAENPPDVICVSDKFSSECNHNWMNDKEQVDQDKASVNIRILKTKLTDGSKTSIKNWLKSNPVTIVYQLATPQIIELPNFNPQTYKGNNTLLINSGVIQCDVSFDVCEGIRSELGVIKDKVSSLDCDYVEDIELQFLNGWIKNTSGYYSAKMINGVAYINLLCSGGIGTAGTPICYIKDQKFRPKTNMHIIIGTNSGLYVNAFIQVTGKIVIDHVDIPPNIWTSICVSYPIL